MMRTPFVLAACLAGSLLAIGPAQSTPTDGTGTVRPDRTDAATTRPVQIALNWDQVSGNWKQLSGKVKQQWGKLTDDDITVAAGRREELIGKIQVRYGISKEEAERQVDRWLETLEQ